MNTATQLLEQCAEAFNRHWKTLADNIQLRDDLKAYLAKQQSVSPETVLEPLPVAMVHEYISKATGVRYTKPEYIYGVQQYPAGTLLYTQPQTRESMCINGCKEACAYCLKHHGKP
jgi:hypothetical protein